MRDLPTLQDDGLLTPAVGNWAETKYRLVWYYSSMFAKAMRDRWDCRVYVDLFAGPGRARIRDTSRIVPTSPVLAIHVECPFDRYVFCEIDQCRIETLEARVSRHFPAVDARYVRGDCNAEVRAVIAAMPTPSKSHTVLFFCFVDPYSLQNLHFATIEAIATSRFVDFLVLVPAYMDAQRNLGVYLDQANTRVEDFLSLPDWRRLWQSRQSASASLRFGSFIVDQFGLQMRRLDYLYGGLPATELVRGTRKDIPLYRLAFFSRSQLGQEFWEEARKYSQKQLRLF